MSRKNRTPEENARRAKIRELLQESNITSMADIQSLFRETIAEFMQPSLLLRLVVFLLLDFFADMLLLLSIMSAVWVGF